MAKQFNGRDVNSLKQQEDDSFGQFFLTITIRGVDVKNSNILDIRIRENIFSIVPTLEMTFFDYGIFTDVFPLGDEDEILVNISTDKEQEGIKTSFVMNDYSIIPRDVNNMNSYIISFTATLRTRNIFYPQYSRAFSRVNSSDVITSLFEEAGFNVVEPVISKDTMMWIQSRINNLSMIHNVLDYSYLGTDTTMFAYIDKHNNAYIKDLKTETRKPKSFDLLQSTDPSITYYKQIKSIDKKLTTLGYNFFRMGFHNGTNNKTGGYGVSGYRYNYNAPTKYWDEVDIKNLPLLDLTPLTDYSLKNKTNATGNIFESAIFPMKYKGSNVHDNYEKAYLINKYIKKTFFSDVMVVNSYFNDEVKLFDKINVTIESLAKQSESGEINKIYSGEYIVVGIINQVSKDGAYKSILYLSRGGINKSPFIEDTEMKLYGAD